MKRRQFLTATALAALFAQPMAHAVNKKEIPAKAKPKSAAANAAAKKKPAPAAKGGKSAPASKTPPRSGSARAPARSAAAAAAESDDGEPMPAAETPSNAISLPDEPLPQWRNYEIRSALSFKNDAGRSRLWLPLVQYRDTPWERSLGHTWSGNFETAGIYRDPVADMEVFFADWSETVTEAKLEVVSQMATQDRHFDITRRGAVAERGEILRRCLQATELVPTDGVVRRTAERAVGRIKDPLAQAKAIYDWVVENTNYDPQMKSSGHTHIGRWLESGQLNGGSTEIALLFVGLCRSIGIPARPAFGLRIDASRLFSSLGASGNLGRAQHCRAELYSPGYGWVPVNPGDVRKAAQGEGLSQFDPKLNVLKKLLFGFWEMNWVAFNAAQDILLRGSSGKPLPLLGGPVLETRAGRFDDLAGGRLDYQVTAQRTS